MLHLSQLIMVLSLTLNTDSPNDTQPLQEESHHDTTIPTNEIWYTTIRDIGAITPHNVNAFDANIVSNHYDEEQGHWVISFDSDVTMVGERAFWFCGNLTSVTLPDSVTTIGDSAFSNCSDIATLRLGSSLTTIESHAFQYCRNLTSITIPDGVISIGEDAFSGCSSLSEFKGRFASNDGRCLVIDNTIIAYAEGSGSEYTIPQGITQIGQSAFEDCTSLVSITLPNSVITIAQDAFNSCSNLKGVTLGSSLRSIEDRAFAYCNALESIRLPDTLKDIGESSFYECSNLKSVVIPDSVTKIKDSAFADCGLTSVTIGRGVTTIGGRAFDGSSGRLTIYSKAIAEHNHSDENYPTTKYEGWLYGWLYGTQFNTLIIGKGIERIGDYLFCGCSRLTSVTLPSSISAIGTAAFYECYNLTGIYCKAETPPSCGDKIIYTDGSTYDIYVPIEAVEAYKGAPQWSSYVASIKGYSF